MNAASAAKKVVTYKISKNIRFAQEIVASFDAVNSRTDKVKFKYSKKGKVKIIHGEDRGSVMGWVRRLGRGKKIFMTDRGMASQHRSEITAVHEMFHLKGLAHTDNPNSIMYPRYSLNVQVSDYDIERLECLYTRGCDPNKVEWEK
jgi:predicted Zn-dependent protease